MTHDLEIQWGSRGCQGTCSCKISSSYVQRLMSYLRTEKKHFDENNTAHRYRMDSNK